MLKRIGSNNRLLLLGLAVSAGCRMGVPLEHNVQISRQLGADVSADPGPETRLAPAGRGPAADTGRTSSVAHRQPVGDTPSYSLSDRTPAGEESRENVLVQFSDAVEDEDGLAALIHVFRNSPPEVQRELLGQLSTAIRRSEAVGKTEQPVDITAPLVRSLQSLPALPDDLEDESDPNRTPIRLAVTSSGEADSSDVAEIRQVIGSTNRAASTAEIALAVGSENLRISDQDLADRPEGPRKIADRAESTEDAERTGSAALPEPSLNELFAALIDRLRQPNEGETDGERIVRELTRSHLQVLAGDAEWSVDAFAGMSPAERTFLRNHLAAVGKLVDPSGHPVPARRFALALPEYREATRQLGMAAEHLEIRTAAFCQEFNGFGQVKRHAEAQFQAGQKVFLYCEVDNFVAEAAESGFETELQGSYEIFDSSGNKVAGQVLPTDLQRCDQPIRDYCVAYEMQLPTSLEPGDYRLELTMECVRGKKFGQIRLPIEIGK
ncbi:MAG: hypothetical protein EA381_01925 [Planctomycetaceae bacterium]|nr:MAG: hypothetical protein EA381_01925 [Planctomycetaceae bacterium]